MKESVSTATIKRRLKQFCLYGRNAVRKSFLRKNNRLKFQWAKKIWKLDNWTKVLWSDKSKFEVFDSKRQSFVRHSAKKNTSKLYRTNRELISQWYGNVFVWKNRAYRIDILRKEQDKEILKNYTISLGLQLIGFIMRQDNDPK